MPYARVVTVPVVYCRHVEGGPFEYSSIIVEDTDKPDCCT